MADPKNEQKYALPQLNPQIQASQDFPDEPFIIPLNGQLMLSEDPSLIGNNYRQITNMRYTDTHPEGVLGMTRINATALSSYLKVRSIFHFMKDNTGESHVLVQAYEQTITNAKIYTNDTAIPNTGDFTTTELWTDSDGALRGCFSNAPAGHIAYCNGVDNCIWGGTKTNCSAFIATAATLSTASDTPTNPVDYTDIINNTKQTVGNVFTIGGGSDTYTKVLIHAGEADGTAGTGIIDSSTTAHVFTTVGNAEVDTAFSKFGTGSLRFYGGYMTTPGHSDFSFGSGDFCVDLQWRVPTLSAGSNSYGICGQYKDVNNFWQVTYATFLFSYSDDFVSFFTGVRTLKLYAKNNGVTVADYTWSWDDSTSWDFSTIGNWFNPVPFRHLAIRRNGSSVDCYLDGSAITNKTVTTGISTMPYLPTTAFRIGSDGINVFSGHIDEFRLSKGNSRWISNFTVPSAPYAEEKKGFLVGCTRPAQGIYIELSTGGENTLAGVPSVKEFTGNSWSLVPILSDGTAVTVGVPLGKNGELKWVPTTSTSQQKYIEGYYLYWYLVEYANCDATISNVKVDMPFQAIKDVWDGYYRTLASAYSYATDRKDVVLNLFEYTYTATDDSTYFGMNSYAITSYITPGFTTRQTGLYIAVPDEYTNNSASVLDVYYWDGDEYKSVGVISDGTSVGGKSLATSGVITWSNASIYDESKKSIEGLDPFYYYKLQWRSQLDGSTRIYYIGGIPEPNDINGYSFASIAANRLMLGCNIHEARNELIISGDGQPDVFNGGDYYKINFGDEESLTGIAPIFAQYASNIYNIVLVFKKTETWSLLWSQTSTGVVWSRYKISPNIGCPAPATITTTSVVFENNVNQGKLVAIWRGNDGIYLSNGQSPFKLSKDINNIFDQSSSLHVNLAMLPYEYSFVDKANNEYHWLWASGANTTLDKEYVLDLQRWKWFDIDRTSGVRIQCGTSVCDTLGNHYTYGCIDTGYMERLENGTSFDGEIITNTLWFGDMLPVQNNFLQYRELLMANLITVAKNASSTVTLTHYLDGNPSGTSYTMSMSDSVHRIANDMQDIYSTPGVFHGIKLVTSSTAEIKGFEPLYFAIYTQKVREHTR